MDHALSPNTTNYKAVTQLTIPLNIAPQCKVGGYVFLFSIDLRETRLKNLNKLYLSKIAAKAF